MDKDKDTQRLKSGLTEFVGVVLLSSFVLYIAYIFVPSKLFNIRWLDSWFPFIIAVFWGMIMGALLMFGLAKLNEPIHSLIHRNIPNHQLAVSESISEALIIACSMIITDQFQILLEKMIGQKWHIAPLFERVIGFLVGRGIIIGIAIFVESKIIL